MNSKIDQAAQKDNQTVAGLDLNEVAENSPELVVLLVELLQKHGHIASAPTSLEQLLVAARSVCAPVSPEYVVIQEGESGEFTAHIYGDEGAAEFKRYACAKAAYKTSDIIEVPGLVARQPGLLEVLEEVAAASQNLSQPESPIANIAPEDRLRLNVWAIGEGDCDMGGIYSVELEEIAATQSPGVRAAAALDILFATYDDTVVRAEANGDYQVHVVDHKGNVVTPDASGPQGKWGQHGTVDLVEDDAEDLSSQPNGCIASHIE